MSTNTYAAAVYAFSHLHQTKETTMIQPLIIKLLAEGGTPPVANAVSLIMAINEIDRRGRENAIGPEAWLKKLSHDKLPKEVEQFIVEALVPWYFLLNDYDDAKKVIPKDAHKALALTKAKEFSEFCRDMEFRCRSYPGTDLEQYWPQSRKRLNEIRAALAKNQDQWSVAALHALHPSATALYQWFWTTYAFFELETCTRVPLFIMACRAQNKAGVPDANHQTALEALVPNLKVFEDALCRKDGTPCLPLATDFTVPMSHLSTYTRNFLNAVVEDLGRNLILPKEHFPVEVKFHYHESSDTNGSITLNPDGSFTAQMDDGCTLHGDQQGTAPEYHATRIDTGTYTRQGDLVTFTIIKSHYHSSGDFHEDFDMPLLPLQFHCRLHPAEVYDYYITGNVKPEVVLTGYPENESDNLWWSYRCKNQCALVIRDFDGHEFGNDKKRAYHERYVMACKIVWPQLQTVPVPQKRFTNDEAKAHPVWTQTPAVIAAEGKLTLEHNNHEEEKHKEAKHHK